MKKQIHLGRVLVLSLILMLVGINKSFSAQDCLPGGDGQDHSAMRATIDIKLSGVIKKHDELGRYTFERESGRGGIAQCGPDSQVYGYATYGEGSGIYARYYGDIDGRPAYHVHAGGPANIVYVLIDNRTGLPFRNRPGQELPVPEGSLMPLDATVIFYAAKDNPTPTTFTNSVIGSVLIKRFESGGGSTKVGFTYRLKGKVESAPTSCSAQNTDLTFTLPRLPITAFSSIGFPSQSSAVEENIKIVCTGNVSAKIKLIANKTESYDGKDAVIKIDNEGQGSNASGIGYVVKSPLSNDNVLVNQTFVKLADLEKGETMVPLKAEYYRYSHSIKAGKAEATAQFVLQFD
ncbi:fimbrial protein [Providencia vermicola]|uniref:Type 1 fimbrial protein n=2 Tax=Providencia TaxID=586 RepID=A0AAI9MVK4_PROST|nr:MULTISPECIES: fimbrial protein [Providencia]ELR5043045.1 type 1 fimbrial protein [Providencia rettgeri]ELR5035903.1 type 1 fimbrial protein [Providencia stuartii]ELR5121946.1 type 1 fimbrial protein [Providencia stuartii]ELR5140788.1 type 1 fimbrial protein [Providencia stuartii]ELR5290185.1 type 1 fimbrial protein [Providencia stuartii]